MRPGEVDRRAEIAHRCRHVARHARVPRLREIGVGHYERHRLTLVGLGKGAQLRVAILERAAIEDATGALGAARAGHRPGGLELGDRLRRRRRVRESGAHQVRDARGARQGARCFTSRAAERIDGQRGRGCRGGLAEQDGVATCRWLAQRHGVPARDAAEELLFVPSVLGAACRAGRGRDRELETGGSGQHEARRRRLRCRRRRRGLVGGDRDLLVRAHRDVPAGVRRHEHLTVVDLVRGRARAVSVRRDVRLERRAAHGRDRGRRLDLELGVGRLQLGHRGPRPAEGLLDQELDAAAAQAVEREDLHQRAGVDAESRPVEEREHRAAVFARADEVAARDDITVERGSEIARTLLRVDRGVEDRDRCRVVGGGVRPAGQVEIHTGPDEQ